MKLTEKQHAELVDILKATVRKYIKDEDTVHDLAMEAYTDLLSSIPPSSHPFTYGTKLVEWRALNYLNQEKNRKRIEDENPFIYEGVNPENISDDPEDVVAAEEAVERINNLTPALRTVLTDYYINGFSVAEIAAKEDTTENAVKVRLHRAREEVKGNNNNE